MLLSNAFYTIANMNPRGYNCCYMSDDDSPIGPKLPVASSPSSSTLENKLSKKLNHFFLLRDTNGLSLNQQLASLPDFHAPGITETLLDFLRLDPWGSNLADDVAFPTWEGEEQDAFDYLKVAQTQRQEWESKNPHIMGAATRNPLVSKEPKRGTGTATTTSQQPRKRI